MNTESFIQHIIKLTLRQKPIRCFGNISLCIKILYTCGSNSMEVNIIFQKAQKLQEMNSFVGIFIRISLTDTTNVVYKSQWIHIQQDPCSILIFQKRPQNSCPINRQRQQKRTFVDLLAKLQDESGGRIQSRAVLSYES